MNAVNDISKINDKYTSLSVFKRYSQGNSIKEIAFDIVDYLDTEKLSDHINSLFDKNPTKKAEYKEAVCNKFKSDLENITSENMAETLSELFVTIIKDAAVQSKRNKSKSYSAPQEQSLEINVSENTNIATSGSRDKTVIAEKDLNSMNDIVNHIVMIFNKIRLDSSELSFNGKSEDSSERNNRLMIAIDADYLLFT